MFDPAPFAMIVASSLRSSRMFVPTGLTNHLHSPTRAARSAWLIADTELSRGQSTANRFTTSEDGSAVRMRKEAVPRLTVIENE